MENWVFVKGYETKYMVSDLGNIKSLPKQRRKKEITLKQMMMKSGYLCVDLCKDGTVKKLLTHRIVATNFLNNEENKSQVNHINGTKTDNRIENLEWNTRSENQLHAVRIGLRTTIGIKNSQCKIDEKTVIDIFNDKRKYKEISIEHRVSIPTICDIKRGYSWSHITGMENIKKRKRKNNLY